MVKRTNTKTTGFTLTEVLVAICILAVTSLAMISTLMFSKQLQTEGVQINEGAEVAQAVIESLRKMPYIVLDEAVPPGNYKVEDLGTVYDGALNPHVIIESGLLQQIRSRLDQRDLVETVHVERGADALLVSVDIHKSREPGTILVSMTSYVVQNGIHFN
jgi:prepilin-type N-terminal cleavage/methylation domain-containing protein